MKTLKGILIGTMFTISYILEDKHLVWAFAFAAVAFFLLDVFFEERK